MASISSLGLSGLPLTDLLNNLQKNENQALAVIQSRQTAAEAKVSGYGKLKDAIASFQKAADAVGKADAFGAIAAKTGSDAFSVTTTNKAIAGQYSIQVDSLAAAQTLVYDGRGSRTDDIGTGGTVTFTVNGEDQTLDLTGKGTSLNDLVKAINADPDLGVNATLVNNGTDGSQYQLLLTNRETGTEAAVSKIQVDGNADLQAFLGYDSGNGSNPGITVSAATDASLSINGIAITSQTNTIENVIDGVSLTLNKTTEEATSLSLTQDPSVAKKAIEDFVKAYNSLNDTIKSLTSYDMENQKSSALTGDSLTRTVQTRMRDAISSAFSASGTNLGEIGITTDPKTGKLEIDNTKLDKALADDTEGVKSLFTSDTGIGKRVSDTADTFIKSDGMLTTTKTGMEKTVADIKKQYEATAERINQRMDTYRNQFTQLDAMVSQMNSLSSYLSQQLSALSANNKS
ncbi:flagellar filament capping protein FliD [Castellaniella hirudinis]|uniref:flagellar filament capping protein FliD n=1 Tax=Castellaniella hirudinis TaxID=1144617 RepID=UPI0039C11A7C